MNGQDITRAQVDKYYRTQLNPEAPQPSQDEALSLKLNILDELINNQILLAASQENWVWKPRTAKSRTSSPNSRAPTPRKNFSASSRREAIPWTTCAPTSGSSFPSRKVINHEVVAKIAVTDQDVQDFYNQNRAQFNVAEPQYRLAQIVITPHKDPGLRNRKNDDATTDAEARRKAAALEQQLSTGADFSQIAMDYSEDPATSGSGGDLGYVPESSLSQSDPALKKAVLSLKPGQISGVIALRDSYRILKLVAKEAPGQRELSDPSVQQSIRDNIHNRKEQLLRAAYLAMARDNAKITNYLAQQIVETAGKLPVVVPQKPDAAGSAPLPQP